MKNALIRIAFVLFLGLFFSNGAIANNRAENADNKCIGNLSGSLINGKYRYLGYCFDGAGFTLYIYTDEHYYYYSLCDTDYDLNKEGCRPERLYRDDTGWHMKHHGEKYYLIFYKNGDRCIVRNMGRDLYH